MSLKLKAAVIAIINRKINDLTIKEEIAQRDLDLIRIGHYRMAKQILIELIREIQTKI